MRGRFSKGVFLAFFLVILTACGCLPSIVLRLADTQHRDTEQISQMNVNLPERMEKDLSMEEKLLLLDGVWIDLKEGHKSPQQIQEDVRAQLDQYEAHGLIPDTLLEMPFTFTPFLCCNKEHPEQNNTVWILASGNGDYEELESIGLTVDEETGHILEINVTAPGLFDEEMISSQVSEAGSVFLDNLGFAQLTGISLSGQQCASVEYTIESESEPGTVLGTLTVCMEQDQFYTHFQMMQP